MRGDLRRITVERCWGPTYLVMKRNEHEERKPGEMPKEYDILEANRKMDSSKRKLTAITYRTDRLSRKSI